MDYVSLASVGIDNLVAGMGTAMTAEQATLLARYSRKAVLLYDSDMAGMKATFRSGDALLRAGVEPLVATLPQGEDPDSLARKGGAAAVAQVIADAVDVLDRKLQILEQRGFFGDIEGTRHALDRLLPTVRAAADPALKDIYVSRVAERTRVRRETIERALTSDKPLSGAVAGRRDSRSDADRRAGQERRAEGKQERTRGAERQLVVLLLRDASRIEPASRVLQPSHFRDPVYRELYDWVVGGTNELDRLSADAKQQLELLQNEPMEFGEGDRAFDDMVGDLLVRPLKWEERRLRREMKQSTDDAQRSELYQQIIALRQREREIKEQSNLGFKTTRYRAVRMRIDHPVTGQGE